MSVTFRVVEGDWYRHGLMETIYLGTCLMYNDSPGGCWLIEGFTVTNCMNNHRGEVSFLNWEFPLSQHSYVHKSLMKCSVFSCPWRSRNWVWVEKILKIHFFFQPRDLHLYWETHVLVAVYHQSWAGESLSWRALVWWEHTATAGKIRAHCAQK